MIGKFYKFIRIEREITEIIEFDDLKIFKIYPSRVYWEFISPFYLILFKKFYYVLFNFFYGKSLIREIEYIFNSSYRSLKNN